MGVTKSTPAARLGCLDELCLELFGMYLWLSPSILYWFELSDKLTNWVWYLPDYLSSFLDIILCLEDYNSLKPCDSKSLLAEPLPWLLRLLNASFENIGTTFYRPFFAQRSIPLSSAGFVSLWQIEDFSLIYSGDFSDF